MRYRRKLGFTRVLYWFVWPSILAAGLLRRGYPIWQGVVVGVAGVLACLPSYLYWYWQILPDRLVQQRYWNRIELPFAEITYIGPMTGSIANNPRVRNWIEVRALNNQRVVVDAADSQGFLAEMRTHLPQITLNL